MAAHSFEDLIQHVGHKLACVTYGKTSYGLTQSNEAVNVTVECETCGEVLIDFDKEAESANREN